MCDQFSMKQLVTPFLFSNPGVRMHLQYKNSRKKLISLSEKLKLSPKNLKPQKIFMNNLKSKQEDMILRQSIQKKKQRDFKIY